MAQTKHKDDQLFVAPVEFDAAVSFDSTIAVTGASTLTGAVTMGGALTVAGLVTMSAAATVGTTLGVTGALTASAALTVGTTLGVTGIATFTAAPVFTAQPSAQAEAVTATADGLTTGLITTGKTHIAITCDTATKQVTLPAALAGMTMHLSIAATGCEIITPASSNETINGVDADGGTYELAMPANSYICAECVVDGQWVAHGWALATPQTQLTLVPDGV